MTAGAAPLTGKAPRKRFLPALELFFFACFVILWFKDNIEPLRSIRLGFWIPLLPLLGLWLYRFWTSLRAKTLPSLPKPGREAWIPAGLLLLAVVLRLPFLAHSPGLMTSDDSIPALMGKHIAEGNTPPICMYGQLYIGSLASHVFALAFKIFGYSILVLKLTTLAFYLAFMAVQFLLLKELFRLPLAAAVTFFYSLPFPGLVIVSFDNTLEAPLVIFLGALTVYVSYLISFKDKTRLLPLLGFLVGLSFWTHQLTASFIAVAIVLIAWKARPRPQQWAALGIYATAGALPQIMIEIYWKLQIIGFLLPGEKGSGLPALDKAKRTASSVLSLLTESGSPLRFLLLVLLGLGFVSLIFLAVKKDKPAPAAVYGLFSILAVAMFYFSRFGDKGLIRYLYTFYFALPVLLLVPFFLIRSKLRTVLSFAFIAILFTLCGARGSLAFARDVKDADVHLKEVIGAMERTGQRYWLGEYWTAYLITAVSGERLIVDSYTVNRYFPYRLRYYDENEGSRFVFLRGEGSQENAMAIRLADMLTALGIPFRKTDVGVSRLVTDIPSPVYPRSLVGAVPEAIPRLDLVRSQASGGTLHLIFENRDVREGVWFRLTAEVPGYSVATRMFNPAEKNVEMRVPYPSAGAVPLRYVLDYQGMRIPSSLRETSVDIPEPAPAEKRRRILYLRGFGPVDTFFGAKMRVVEKEAAFELNGLRPSGARLRLDLFSPLEFSHLHWYGVYTQAVEISFNGNRLLDAPLRDGENKIEIGLGPPGLKPKGNILSLKFKYHLPLAFQLAWKAAALLEKIEVN